MPNRIIYLEIMLLVEITKKVTIREANAARFCV